MQKIVPNDAILIPDNASRVFEGDLFDVYQWPQTMFDGTTKTFEMLRRPDTVYAIVVDEQDRIAIIEDEQPGRSALLGLPGGRVDYDDATFEIAAQREVREEIGVTCSTWKLLSDRHN